MILEGYGIILRRLTVDDIELVRQKRNSDAIRSVMIFQDKISAEQQLKWFSGIDNEFNNYFLIYNANDACGMISGAEINWETMETGNGGIFIWNHELWSTDIPARATFLLTDFSFLIGFKKTIIRIRKDNEKAAHYNESFGYQKVGSSIDDKAWIYELTSENYARKTDKLRALLLRDNGNRLRCTITAAEHPSAKKIVSLIANLMPEQREKFEFEIK